jgi:hypothetical protein
MQANELRDLLLSSRPYAEKHALLPSDARGIALSYRIDDAKTRTRKWRIMRCALIGLAVIYFGLLGQERESAMFVLFLGLIWYEFAYEAAAKVRAELADAQARERLRVSVDEYLQKRFPSFAPPGEGASIFSVSPE